jgi:hypothetical protein
MPRHNWKAAKRPLSSNARRNSIDVYKYIDNYPTPTTKRRRASKKEVPDEETTERSPRVRTRMGGSE